MKQAPCSPRSRYHTTSVLPVVVLVPRHHSVQHRSLNAPWILTWCHRIADHTASADPARQSTVNHLSCEDTTSHGTMSRFRADGIRTMSRAGTHRADLHTRSGTIIHEKGRIGTISAGDPVQVQLQHSEARAIHSTSHVDRDRSDEERRPAQYVHAAGGPL